MAGIRWPPEDSDLIQPRASGATTTVTASDLISDDDRSIAADSWSIKSEYGSTLDDEQRHVDAAEVLSAGTFRAASDYSTDKEDEPDANEVEPSMLGQQSYWDAAYAEDLANFHEHGQAGEVWFGVDVMDNVVAWTKNLCISLSREENSNDLNDRSHSNEDTSIDLSGWSVLDIGTGNGILLHELKKQGFTDLTGTDYSEAAIDLARNLAVRDGVVDITFLVDDVLDTKLDKQYKLILDKGTLDAIGLHPEGATRRVMYWETVSKLVAPGGLLVLTSCNHTKEELVQEVENFNQRFSHSETDQGSSCPVFEYLDNIRTYPTIMFGGVEGSRVATVAFRRN